jgi:hypothetical protein
MALSRFSFTWLLCIAAIASECAAQNRGSQNQRSSFGQGGGGQSGFGQSAFGQGGQSAFGGAGVGRGQSRGGAGAGYGANAFGAGSGTGFGGVPSGQFGNNQIAGPGQGGFLGGDANQTQNFFRALNGGQRRTAMFDYMIENLNEMRDRGNGGGNGDRTPPVRVKLRPAFETPLGTMAKVATDVQARLAISLAEQGVVDSRLSLEGRTMTLEGRVATEHQKALIAKMASLEPGVSDVDNRLIVDPTVASEE